MNHGSLFSGGGGFDLAAELAGWENLFHCEWNPFCQTILNHYWPNAVSYKNIKEFNAKEFEGKIDVLTGGFPCQPFSASGKRRGTSDNRYLWPEMLRVIRECQPNWIIGENVYGLVDWNGGMVFDQVFIDLESEGYEVQAFVLPASGVNAPHRRYRVWFVACRGIERRRIITDSFGFGHGQTEPRASEEDDSKRSPNDPIIRNRLTNWKNWPTQPSLCGRNDGLPDRLDGITFSKWRRESLKIYGNAVVPQVVLQIFRVINIIEKRIREGRI